VKSVIKTKLGMTNSDKKIDARKCRFVKETTPGYFWFHSSSVKRISRYQTQKRKLKKLLGVKFDAALTEEENMVNAGYMKIYDAGHKLYVI
jgi:hypothetical protein